jgi:inner membrane protein
VDPASHLLLGCTFTLTARRASATPGTSAALVLGSIMPDVDVLLAPIGFDLYLRAHASGTHSLAGSLLEAAILAGFLYAVVRGSRFPTLLIASWIGILGHVVSDVADGSDINVLKPFSPTVFGWHLLSMGDPIVLSGLACAVVLALKWPLHARRFGAGALLALVCFVGVKSQSQQWAVEGYRRSIGADAPNSIEISPEFGLFDWTIYDRVDDRVRGWSVNGRSGTLSLKFERQDANDKGAIAVSRQLPVVRAFLSWSRIPFARIEADGPRRLILWSDARGCSTTGCSLSFGGAFNPANTPLYQVIQIGSFKQLRPLPDIRLPGT